MACLNTPATDDDRRKLRRRISGGINAAPLWIRQYQARAKMKLATDDEHGAAANRTAHLGSDLGISCKVVCTRPRELPVTNHTCIIHPPVSSHPPDILEKLLKLGIGCAMGIRKDLLVTEEIAESSGLKATL